MIVIPFEKDLHLREILQWIESRAMKKTLAEEIPEHGCVVEGIAAGFIRRLENSKTALFDSLISNPTRNPRERNEAINLVAASVIKKAKELGLDYLHATSVDEHTLERSLQFGFQVLPHRAILLKLEGEV